MSPRPGRRRFGAALLAGLAAAGLALAGPALAQQDPGNAPDAVDPLTGRPVKKKKPPPVNMVVVVGQENTAREDRAVPIRVILDNNDKALTGRIEVRDMRGGVTQTPFELPRRGHQEYTLFARLSPDPEDPQRASGEVALMEGARTVAREKLSPIYPGETAVLVSATGDATGLQFLEKEKRADYLFREKKYRVSQVSPQDLPRLWPGYEPATIVAVTGLAWQQMNEYQKSALRTWIEQGGKAVLCADSSLHWRDADGKSLAAVEPRDVVSLPELRSVAAWGQGPFRAQAGTLLTVSGPLAPGSRAVAYEGGRPLIVTRRCLRGWVLWMGFNPFGETFRAWDGSDHFWQQAIETLRRQRAEDEGGSLQQVEAARQAVTSLPRLPAPPMGAIVAFGVVYAIIFGPLNIWMLRRLRRTVRAWLFMPSLAAAMTVVVLFVGQSWGSSRTVLNSLSVLRGASGSRTAMEESLIGLFSPTNRAFDLTIDDPAPTFEDVSGIEAGEGLASVNLGWPDFQENGAVRWDAVAMQLFSVRTLAQRRPRDLGGSVDVRIDGTRPAGSPLVGTVTNGTLLPLRRAYLHRRGRFYWLGDLPVGKSVTLAAASWTGKLEQKAKTAGAADPIERRAFQDRLDQLWREAPASLAAPGGKEALWLIAECDRYRPGLEVAGVPYNSRAGLLVLSVPLENPDRRP